MADSQDNTPDSDPIGVMIQGSSGTASQRRGSTESNKSSASSYFVSSSRSLSHSKVKEEAELERRRSMYFANQSMEQFLRGLLFQNNKNQTDISFKRAMTDIKVIGFYFTSHSNPTARSFTETLKKAYSQWESIKKFIEIIVVSQHENEEEFKVDFKDNHGKWLAMKWDHERRQSLVDRWDVDAPPTLIFVNKHWDILSLHGVMITNTGKMAVDELIEKFHVIQEEKKRSEEDLELSLTKDSHSNSEHGDPEIMVSEEELFIDEEDEDELIENSAWGRCCCCKRRRFQKL